MTNPSARVGIASARHRFELTGKSSARSSRCCIDVLIGTGSFLGSLAARKWGARSVRCHNLRIPRRLCMFHESALRAFKLILLLVIFFACVHLLGAQNAAPPAQPAPSTNATAPPAT